MLQWTGQLLVVGIVIHKKGSHRFGILSCKGEVRLVEDSGRVLKGGCQVIWFYS